jgi:hypothetical protein
MKISEIPTNGITFQTCEQARPGLIKSCEVHPDIAEAVRLGKSEEGREIDAFFLGNGDTRISLIAGAHSDEPVGPETLRLFVRYVLANKASFTEFLQKHTFAIVPHINPDGEAKNRAWIAEWPSFDSYIRHAFREPPGRDLEFGFPDMRIENRLVSEFLQHRGPFFLHMSLHGMGIADGAMLLIERHWIDRTGDLREKYQRHLIGAGLGLHDHDRKGDKGFQYIAPGFSTTPEGHAMREYFDSIGDAQTAALFHNSSMEFVRSLGGEPLCLVTELPLFLIRKNVDSPPGVPGAYLEFKAALPTLRRQAMQDESLETERRQFQIEHVELETLIKYQLAAIELGLEAISRNDRPS